MYLFLLDFHSLRPVGWKSVLVSTGVTASVSTGAAQPLQTFRKSWYEVWRNGNASGVSQVGRLP